MKKHLLQLIESNHKLIGFIVGIIISPTFQFVYSIVKP